MYRSPLPIIATLVTFLAVVIMFTLGLWQLQRADEKSQRLAAIELAAVSAPLDLSTALVLKDEARDFPIHFEGTAQSTKYFLLDNRIQQGKVGYEVIVPVKSELGEALVNFGWVAAPALRSDLPVVSISGVEKEYQGMLAIPLKNSLINETAIFDQQWPKVVQQIDISLMAQHYEQTLMPFVILLNKDTDTEYLRNWQPVVMKPEKHIAYAIQWFLLAGAAPIIFIIAQRRRKSREVK